MCWIIIIDVLKIGLIIESNKLSVYELIIELNILINLNIIYKKEKSKSERHGDSRESKAGLKSNRNR